MSVKNLFSSNKFKFNLTGERFKGNNFDLTVTGLNIPGIQLGIVPIGTSIRQIERPGDNITFNDLTVEFLITEDFDEYIEIYNWMNDLRNFKQTEFDNTILSDGKLILLTNKSNPNIIFTFIDIFPVDLNDLDLTLNTADGESVRGSVTFKFLDFTIDKIN